MMKHDPEWLLMLGPVLMKLVAQRQCLAEVDCTALLIEGQYRIGLAVVKDPHFECQASELN